MLKCLKDVTLIVKRCFFFLIWLIFLIIFASANMKSMIKN